MANLYPFIQGSLYWPFSELFSANVSWWNRYRYIAFNIFSCRIVIILYKIFIIIGRSNEKNKWINHIWNIMSKRHNILTTRNSFFISSTEKIERVREFKIKLFKELFHFGWQPYEDCMATCISFQRTWCFALLRWCPFV